MSGVRRALNSSDNWIRGIYTWKKTEIHVSLNGDDNNTGTESNALQSSHAAQSAVRRMLQEKTGAAVNVIIHSGTYYFKRPLILGKEDSGTEDAPVVWQGAYGEFPVITGTHTRFRT